MTEAGRLVEMLTGRMRPRHRRFAQALGGLMATLQQPYSLLGTSTGQRIRTRLLTSWQGLRALPLDQPGAVGLIHQALNTGSMPYMAEFDVPLAIHGYHIGRHRRAVARARALMEQPGLRALITFSDWASRSFDLHYGPVVGAKCRTVYPLAYEGAWCGVFDARLHDFCFISTRFRIKSGPEVVRAFCKARALLGSNASLCVVTSLAEARQWLGPLENYPGVSWREANLNEQEIAALLADSRCLLHPSLSDSFGVVVLEALAAGCAIVTADMASFPELVDQNGWLLRPPTATVVGDTYITEYGSADYHEAYLNTMSLHRFEQTLCDTITSFLSDDERARAMMQASHRLHEQKFSLTAWQTRMRGVLQEGFPELGAWAHERSTDR